MQRMIPNHMRQTPQPAPFNIVPAKRDDMSLVADFVSSSADWYRPIVDEKDMAEHEVGEAWAEINFKRRDFYIGIANGKPIGTISLQYFGDYAYLGYIYLDVDQVGNGYGQQLMKFAAEKARQKGMRGMALIGHPKASWARKAYLKFGFDIVASKKNEVLAWQDGVLESYYEQDFELYIYEFAGTARTADKATHDG